MPTLLPDTDGTRSLTVGAHITKHN